MECIICMDNLNNNLMTTNCGHKFHKKCLIRWLKNNKTYHGTTGSCPICRSICYDDSEFSKIPSMRVIIANTIMRMLTPKI